MTYGLPSDEACTSGEYLIGTAKLMSKSTHGPSPHVPLDFMRLQYYQHALSSAAENMAARTSMTITKSDRGSDPLA